MTTLTQPSPSQATEKPARSGARDTIVQCVQLTKVFKDFWLRDRVRAVDRIDLDIHRGEVFGLLGPNGSGKSTTIKMLLGLLRPTAGRVLVFGKRPDDVAIKKQIGYLPEESYLYRFLNARETLEYYGKLFHQNGGIRRKRIDMLLEMVGLDAAARRPVGEFSKGMQRRIGLAQALINDPELLILDEPTTGLDPIGTRQIKDLILELSRRGKTILLCSHLLADVEDVCDRVAIMYGGRIRAAGTVDELLVRTDLTTIEAQSLDPQTIEEIEQVLERRGKHIERVQQPRQRLESLFLDIVQKAQAEGALTSGASNTGRIAQFLTADGAASTAEGEQLIETLMQAQVPASSTSQAAGQAAAQVHPVPEEAPAEVGEQSQVIEALTRSETPPPPPEPPPASESPSTPSTATSAQERQRQLQAAAEDADLDVINDLLGDKQNEPRKDG